MKEQDAAKRLLSKVSPTKVTVHFDTTQRSRIHGEWPAIILNFMNKEQSEYIPLRPITLAFEDKCQIVAFFVETF